MRICDEINIDKMKTKYKHRVSCFMYSVNRVRKYIHA
jgi:hypothetical protein